jgi:hypothetical protein
MNNLNERVIGLVIGIALGTLVLAVAPAIAATETSTTPAAQPVPAPPLPAPPAQQTIKGDVLNIEGEYLVVKDMSGHEIRLHVNKDTRTDNNRLKVGDKISAVVAPDGHAESISLDLPQQQQQPLARP